MGTWGASAARIVRRTLVAALTLPAVSGCTEFAVDTPLGVNADTYVVGVGDAITGEVIYPDGHISVTLAKDPAEPVRPGHGEASGTHGAVPCAYESSSHTYTCSTDGLAEARYVVSVTDAASPGEGTQAVRVVVTSIAGYDPSLGDFGKGPEGYVFFTRGAVTPVAITGWMPAGRIRVEVRSLSGAVRARRTLSLDSSGDAVLRLPGDLPRRALRVFATDGLWEVDYPLQPR